MHDLWTCRCHGAVEELLGAALVVEDVMLRDIEHAYGKGACMGKLLAALKPASGTLRVLNAHYSYVRESV